MSTTDPVGTRPARDILVIHGVVVHGAPRTA
jgi:hypothetical protein